MKIVTGSTAPSLPLLPDEMMLSPDPCSSSAAMTAAPTVKLVRIDSALFPRPTKEEDLATIPMPATTLTDVEENEAEFGEFLLDAVDWL